MFFVRQLVYVALCGNVPTASPFPNRQQYAEKDFLVQNAVQRHFDLRTRPYSVDMLGFINFLYFIIIHACMLFMFVEYAFACTHVYNVYVYLHLNFHCMH